MKPLVSYERRGPVSLLTMDDGKMNVCSPAMLEALSAALDRAQADATVVLLAGREGVLSAGFDLGVFKTGAPAEQVRMLTLGARLAERLLAFPAPVLIACTGHAIAMGVFLLQSADVRLGIANGPFRICANEVAIGMTVPRFAMEVMRLRATPAVFNRALITAEPYDPQQALAAGFLDELVPASELQAVALAKAEALAKLDRKSHVATKLRVREQALEALRKGIEADIAGWTARMKEPATL